MFVVRIMDVVAVIIVGLSFLFVVARVVRGQFLIVSARLGFS